MSDKKLAQSVVKVLTSCQHEFLPHALVFGIMDNVITLEGEKHDRIFQGGIPVSHCNSAIVTYIRCHKCGLIQKAAELEHGNSRLIF